MSDEKQNPEKNTIRFDIINYSALPSVEIAGAIAVEISENIYPVLTTEQQAFFVAGFQECIKYLLKGRNYHVK